MASTRRSFLAAGVAAPALVTSITPAIPQASSSTRASLKVVMDLIIPEGDSMPSATRAGGLAYLEKLMLDDHDAATDIAKGLEVVEAFSTRSFQKPFSDLARRDQISILKEMENSAPGVFDSLRAYVYESYYTNPTIWNRIGYELYPTDHTGPHLAAFDESLVADVRKMPKLYRDA